MHPTKFQVNWIFGSGVKTKNIFLKLPPWQPSWISDRNGFSFFLSICLPDVSYQVSSQMAFSGSGAETKNIFLKCSLCGHLGFPIGTILAIFYLYVTPIFPT